MPAHFFEIGGSFRSEHSLHQISGISAVTRGNRLKRNDLRAGLHQNLCEQKAGGEFEVVTRGAHGDAERFGTDANFERLFGGEIVVLATKPAVIPFGNLREIQLMNFMRHAGFSRKSAPNRRADSKHTSGRRRVRCPKKKRARTAGGRRTRGGVWG